MFEKQDTYIYFTHTPPVHTQSHATENYTANF